MRRATMTQSPGVDLLALLGNRDRKSATDALLQPLVLFEQLEERLHRPPSGWAPQPFQVRHGAAGPRRHEFLDETLHAVFGHVPPQIAMILEGDGLNDAANQHRNRAWPRNCHVGSIQPFSGGLLQPAPRQRCPCARTQMVRELLFDGGIKLP